MKINFPALFQTSLQNYRFFFFFGNDVSVIERGINYVRSRLQIPIKHEEEESLGTLELPQPSLFETHPQSSLTLILNVTDKLLKNIENLKSGLYIFTSEKARTNSKLVEYFKQKPNSLVIACYETPLLRAELDSLAAGVQLDPLFKAKLLKAYQKDPEGFVNAMEKIKLYGEVAENDYDLFLTPTEDQDDFRPLLNSLILKNTSNTVESLKHLSLARAIPFIRIACRTFQSLLELKASRERNWMKLSIPVFFKDQPLYEEALKVWSLDQLRDGLQTLQNLEVLAKFQAPPLSVFRQHVLQISRI